MGLSCLVNDLALIPAGSRVTIDSAPIIYLLEENPTFLAPYLALFERIDKGELEAVISAVTLAEVLAGPLRHGNEILADRYYQALTVSPNWRFQPMTAEISLVAARVRARYGIRLPDAVQVATAIASQSIALITHDRDFNGITDLAVFSA
jgi:predicted nucleic acid-binding protein